MQPLKLELPRLHDRLRLRDQEGQREVWDPVRRRYVILTPEELVRQLFVQYLASHNKAPLASLSIERALRINGRIRRYDLLVHDRSGAPLALVECKRPEVVIDARALSQIAHYNLELQVSWLLVTNGLATYCFYRPAPEGPFEFYPEVPVFHGI